MIQSELRAINDLSAFAAGGLSQMAPKVIGKDYWVLGTIEKKIWQEELESPGNPISETLEHVADFKHQYELGYKPGGWYPVPQEPRRD